QSPYPFLPGIYLVYEDVNCSKIITKNQTLGIITGTGYMHSLQTTSTVRTQTQRIENVAQNSMQ
ncbi:hypothetical protein GBAR_LOCUS12935, partial [Geodia barretti]